MGFPRILSKNNKIYTKLGEYCLAGDSFWIVCHTCQEELQTQDQFWKHIQDEHNFMLGVGLGVVKQEPGGSTRTTTTAATSYCMEVDSTPTGATAATVATAGPSATTMVTLPALSLYHRKYNDDEQHQQQNQQQQQQQQQQQRNDQMTVDLHEQQTHHHHQHHHQQTQQQSQQPQQPTTAQRDATELHAVDENTVPTTTTASGIDIKLEPATNLTLPPPQPDDTQAQIVQQSAANATHSGAVVATSGNTNAATPTTIYHLPQVVPPPPPPVPTQHTQPQPQPQPQQQVTTAAYPPNSNTAASPSHVTSAAAAAAVVAAAAAAANIMHTTATAVTLPSALSISSVAPSTAMTAAAAAAMLAQQQQQQDLPPKDSNSTTASASSAVSSDDGERWYICDYETCGLKFKYMSRLELHRAVHSKERRFICDLCSASFKQSCNLSTHRKKKHALKGKGMILPQR